MMGDAQSQGFNLRPLSGYRSEDDQRRAIQQVAQRNRIPFHDGLYQTGIPGMAAPVGKSMHQHGTAIDWDVSDPQAKAWLYKNAPQYGFRFPLPGSDAGHMQLGGHVEQQQPSNVPSYASPQLQPAAPGGQRMAGGLLGDVGSYLTSAMTSPLFMMGASTYGAASNGGNWAGGLLKGTEAVQQHQMGDLAMQAKRYELAQQDARNRYIGGLNQSDPMFNGLPPGMVALAKGMNDPSIIAQAYKSKMDLDQQERIARMQGNIQLQNHIAQKKADLEAELRNREDTWKMIERLRPPGQGAAQPRRYNPATGELE